MTKRRPRRRDGDIAGLTSYPRADGTRCWRWVPSPRLRRAGWKAVKLGDDRNAAIVAALEILDRVAAWESGADRLAADAATTPRPLPRRWTFGDLVHDYRTRVMPTLRSDKTRSTYDGHLRWLLAWADNGATPVDHLTDDVCTDLRDHLVATVSPWNAAIRLRVLRIIMGHAVRPLRIIKDNPARAFTIPTPTPRRKRISVDALHLLADHADTTGQPGLALALLLGFYTTQREGDLLAATRFTWREMTDIDDHDRAVLVDARGRVMGLRLQQRKTRAWVDVGVPPFLADRIDATIAGHGAGYTGPLIALDVRSDMGKQTDATRAAAFQRAFRALVNAVLDDDRIDAAMRDEIAGLQFRDLRRSGMCWLRDRTVPVAQIATISGHSIERTMRILETYLPSDSRASMAGLARAVRTEKRRARANANAAASQL